MIRTRRHFVNFYLVLLGSALFFLTLSVLLFWNYSKGNVTNTGKLPKEFSLIIAILLVWLAYYTVRRYIRNAPVVVADEISLRVNNNTYLYKNIKVVEFTGKYRFPYLIAYYMEATVVEFKNGEILVIFDDMYRNTPAFKMFLTLELSGNFRKPEQTEKSRLLPEANTYTRYSGAQLLSIRGIMLWIPVVAMLYLLVIEKPVSITSFFVLVGFNLFWFLFNSRLMNYFELGEIYLNVRRHNFLWIKKYYELDEIREVVFETQTRMPYSLRVITDTYYSKLYPAATLSNKTWQKLKIDLERKGIKVRNECIF